MTTTPDTPELSTEEGELIDDLTDALDGYVITEAIPEILERVMPVLAAIRRHAAADALRRKAKSFDNSARMFRDMSAARDRKCDHQSATIYASHATQARTDAEALRKEADGIIAEGYKFECAATFPPATWSSPGYGCETKVPNEGDYCPACEPEDDEDPRWAE